MMLRAASSVVAMMLLGASFAVMDFGTWVVMEAFLFACFVASALIAVVGLIVAGVLAVFGRARC